MSTVSPEKASGALRSVETQKLIVRQPAKLAELGKLLETFDNLNLRVSERLGEDTSQDLGGAGAGGGTAGAGQGDDAVSPRDLAIRNMPAPDIVRQKLEQHIQKEVKDLDKLARRTASMHKPGSAFRLNELYARMRRLQGLLAEIVEASFELLQRMFVRVFIDKQPIL